MLYLIALYHQGERLWKAIETRKMKRKQVVLGLPTFVSFDIDTYSRHRFLITSFNRITFSKPKGEGRRKREKERESCQAFASSLNRMREVSRVCDTLRAFTRNRERSARSRSSRSTYARESIPSAWEERRRVEKERERERRYVLWGYSWEGITMWNA